MNTNTGGGCLLLIVAICGIMLLCPSSVSVPIISDLAARDREQAAADRADAEAKAADAEANKAIADATAYTIRRYTDAGVNAIETDRKQAHKMIWVSEMAGDWIGWMGLCCCLPVNAGILAIAVLGMKKLKRQSQVG